MPIHESEEISFIYQLLNYISDNQLDIFRIAYGYGGSKKIQSHVDSFNNEVPKTFIDYIIIYLSELKIDMGLDKKQVTQFTFNHEFKGQFNHATGQGEISAYQIINENEIENLKRIAKEYVEELNTINEISKEEIVEIVEFLEATIQEVESESPKKAIMKTAMDKVKGVNEFVTTGTTIYIGKTTYKIFTRHDCVMKFSQKKLFFIT